MATSTIQALTPEALNAIRLSKSTRLRLCSELNVVSHTIARWVKSNDPKLTQSKALKIIAEETTIPQSQLLQSA